MPHLNSRFIGYTLPFAFLFFSSCKTTESPKLWEAPLIDVNLKMDQAKQLYLSNQYRQALGPLGEIIEGSTSSLAKSEAGYWAGFCYLKIGDYDSSENSFELALKGLEQDYMIGPAFIGLADSQIGRGKFTKAVSQYEKAINQYPTFIDMERVHFQLKNARKRRKVVYDTPKSSLKEPIQETPLKPSKKKKESKKSKNTRSRFSLQVGAFNERASAKKVMDKLNTHGFTPYIQWVRQQKKPLYCVRLGHFKTKNTAEQKSLQKRLKFLGIESFIVNK